MNELGKLITAKRNEKKLTMEQLAARCEVSLSAISKWEAGKRTPSVRTLRIVAKELGINMEEIYELI